MNVFIFPSVRILEFSQKTRAIQNQILQILESVFLDISINPKARRQNRLAFGKMIDSVVFVLSA